MNSSVYCVIIIINTISSKEVNNIYEFSGKSLIKCLNCTKNFKKKMERKKEVFICSGFANYSKEFCMRYPLIKEDLIYLISKHLIIKNIINEKYIGSLDEFVDRIEVDPKNNSYHIFYKNDTTKTTITPKRLTF